jgi:hypothetical protein
MKDAKSNYKLSVKLIKDLILLILEIFIVLVIAKTGLLGESLGTILILYYGTSCIISMIGNYNENGNNTNITMRDDSDE